jgi:hypothetical protein
MASTHQKHPAPNVAVSKERFETFESMGLGFISGAKAQLSRVQKTRKIEVRKAIIVYGNNQIKKVFNL